jgi:thymidylate synthase ThyX
MQTAAKIIADTVNEYGARITTFEVVAPRFLLAEVNTHRVIAKSAASSRAIPVEKRIAMVTDAPFVPLAFGKNKPGMQADENLDDLKNEEARLLWLAAAKSAAVYAKGLADLGVHKQHANRLLEPFVYYTGVMTSTEWSNFFTLRTHPDAQPEFRELAVIMKTLYDTNRPTKAGVHLPYVDLSTQMTTDPATCRMISAARCARVSYKTYDGKVSTPEKDIELCGDLIKAGHLSPFDHPATSDHASFDHQNYGWFWHKPSHHRHNWGWIPDRVEIEAQQGWICARNSYGRIEGFEP